MRITNWYGGVLDNGTGFGGDGVGITTPVISVSSTPNPGSLDPNAWAAENTLWIAAAAVDTSRTFSAWPTNYFPGSSNWDDVSGGAGGASLSVQYRRLNATSEDPGTFTISASDDWSCQTVAVRPTAVAALILEQGFVDFADPGVL